MNSEYIEHVASRAREGIPPLPLTASQVMKLCEKLCSAQSNNNIELVRLLAERVPPGVAPAAALKADFLTGIIEGKYDSAVVTPEYAFRLLGGMVGGYNVTSLVKLLIHKDFAAMAAAELKKLILIFDNFDAVADMANNDNSFALDVIHSWANAEWFTCKPEIPERISVKVFKIPDVVNNDDLSSPRFAATRSDIPLHARTMGGDKFPEIIEVADNARKQGDSIAFVAPVLGVGSSRKSAVNSLIWNIGRDIPYIPNKRTGGIIIAGTIAPVFLNTFIDSGGLPLICDVSGIKNGMTITINTRKQVIYDETGLPLAEFSYNPVTIPDAYRAGGRVALIIGKKLTVKSREFLNMPQEDIFIKVKNPSTSTLYSFTLAQKIVGKACGKNGVTPGEYCEPEVSAVASQDATGLMTRDELTELACLDFKAPLTLQSFCHTAAYPQEKDLQMHKDLTEYFTTRSGVAIKPGDGIVHSWMKRMLLPDRVATGADSHVHYPLGISFPAGSGLVAFAATLGFMPLEMPESILVRLEGDLHKGITLRDIVGYIALISKENKSLFNGRIIEYEGYTERLTIDEAFELSAAAAERSASGCTVKLDRKQIIRYLQSNVRLLRKMLEKGYECAHSLEKRLAEINSWLKKPELLERDKYAQFAEKKTIQLAEIKEPVIAAPNNPSNVCWLSEHSGTVVDEVFIGSCMANIGHFRAAAAILQDRKIKVKKLWIVPPTRMDMAQLESEGIINIFKAAGARIEVPGCSLCMGNQARASDGAVIFSNSTRNTDNRMGTGTNIYLGSAELAAVTALNGKIPRADEYFTLYNKYILPNSEIIYNDLSIC